MSAMSRTPAPKKTRVITGVALIGFGVLLYFGPLDQASLLERLFAIALLLTSIVLVAFLSRRFAFALVLPCVIFGGLQIASVLKFHYLTTPLLAPDLVYFLNRDLLEVATRYPSIMIALIGGAILIPGLMILAWRLDRPQLFARLGTKPRRFLQLAGAIVCVALLLAIDSPRGPFGTVFEKGMWQAMNDRSYLVNFFTSFYQTQIKIPPPAADADLKLSWTQPATDNPPACNEHDCAAGKTLSIAQEHPDIVAVLEESTFDPLTLKMCTSPWCARKMFQPDGRTRAHGPLVVHVWGGGTWTSEFALLTGLSHLTFGDAGLYAPYNLAPRVNYTLPKVLHAAGYRVIAIYPMSGNFINARNAYKFYGFDAFYDGQDYGLSWESSDNDLIQVFNQLYDKEKKAIGKQPLFVMMLTLRQHGPHMTPLKQLPPPFDKPLFPGTFRKKEFDDWINLNLGNYLQRLAGSDVAITQLEKKLLDGDRPALLFHFGDHQPSFDGAIREIPKIPPAAALDPNFVTYYMLKSNFKPAQEYDYPTLDLSFAGALILDIAGIKKDDFFQANALLRGRCHGAYTDCMNKPLVDAYHQYIFQRIGALHE
jgi:phosphoglycerol transferase MdoB-like AlkP superfamily enzyme